MDNRNRIIIRKANKDEWDDAMALAWKTFMHYVAPDYSKQGQDSFLEFISDSRLHRMFLEGDYLMFVAYDELTEKIVGIGTLRSRNHISLLFVDEKYHKKGIGTKLIDALSVYVKVENKLSSITVHSSPYAKDFYIKQGFEITGMTAENEGMIYTPMAMWL